MLDLIRINALLFWQIENEQAVNILEIVDTNTIVVETHDQNFPEADTINGTLVYNPDENEWAAQ